MGEYVGFREFLDLLRQEEELIEIQEKILPEPDVGALCQATTEMDGPTLFMHIEGYDIPLVCGTHSSLRRIALSLGLNKDASTKKLFETFSSRWNQYPVSPVEIPKLAAPCKECIYEGNDVDLTKLPIVRWNTEDGGPYISKGLVKKKLRSSIWCRRCWHHF